MTTTQPWEIEFDDKVEEMRDIAEQIESLYRAIHEDPTKRRAAIDSLGSQFNSKLYELKSLITSTRLSAYKEGQRDMREEVVKMAEKFVEECQQVKDMPIEKAVYRAGAFSDLISEITK